MDSQKSVILSTAENQIIKLKNDFELLDLILVDMKNQPSIYQPGPFWATTTKNAANEIKRCSLTDFRGSKNLIGMSYADNLLIDIRNAYNYGWRRIVRWLAMTYPFSRVYEAQVRWTEAYANKSVEYAQEFLKIHKRAKDLINKYTMPYSLLGNCLDKAEIGGHDYSIHYLDLLEQHDNIAMS